MGKTRKDFSRLEQRNIALAYACTPYSCDASKLSQKYGCSEDVIYAILGDVILKWMVWEKENIQFIIDKASHNSYYHGGSGGSKLSYDRFQQCLSGRENFHFSAKEAKAYAEGFAKSKLTLKEYAKENAMPVWLLEKTLKQAMEEGGSLSEEVKIILKTKSLPRESKEDSQKKREQEAKRYEGVQMKLRFYEDQRQKND